MPLKSSLRNVSELDLLFRVYVGVAVLVLLGNIYDFVEAWFAPPCRSVREMHVVNWCLPIGFEGPFGDVWANRSWFNARASATFHLIVIALAFAVGTYFARTGHPRSRAI